MSHPTSSRSHAARRLALLGAAVIPVSIAAGAAGASGATGPTVTLTTPTAGSTNTDGRVTVTGTYSGPNKVTSVTVSGCRPDGSRCKDYLLANTNGAFSGKWRGFPARLTPTSSDGKSGTFTVVLSGLPGTRLRISAFASDAVTPRGGSATVNVAVKAPEDPAFISVVFGRASWKAASGEGCTNQPNTARTLEQDAKDMALLGLMGVAQTVTSRVDETERLCPDNFAVEASWVDLARMRDAYGWSLTSQSKTYPDLTKLTTTQVIDETAGTLPIFQAHGHTRAWGSFAYPNNKQNSTVQRIATNYFAFGRKYANDLNSRQNSMVFPYEMRTLSVNGGRCINVNLPCSTMPVVNDRVTTSPNNIGRILKPGPGHWGVVQFYRIVEGVEGKMGQSFAWDCTSSDWRNRWTSQPELYCRNTMIEGLEKRNKSATSVDPAAVAIAWGRKPFGS